jgi:hypothetical protein
MFSYHLLVLVEMKFILLKFFSPVLWLKETSLSDGE